MRTPVTKRNLRVAEVSLWILFLGPALGIVWSIVVGATNGPGMESMIAIVPAAALVILSLIVGGILATLNRWNRPTFFLGLATMGYFTLTLLNNLVSAFWGTQLDGRFGMAIVVFMSAGLVLIPLVALILLIHRHTRGKYRWSETAHSPDPETFR